LCCYNTRAISLYVNTIWRVEVLMSSRILEKGTCESGKEEEEVDMSDVLDSWQ
jgi:hypothetical protein